MTVSVLAPSSAHAQDISFLVVLGFPPFLLTPFAAAVIRRAWFLRASGSAPSGRRLLALHILEFLLWLVATWFAGVVFVQKDWGAAFVVGGVLAAILTLNRRLGARDRSWWFSLAFTSVFPAAWLILQALSYVILVWLPGLG